MRNSYQLHSATTFMTATLLFTTLMTIPIGESFAFANKCFNATPQLARLYSLIRKRYPTCKIKCKGCGCKGGPGYRKIYRNANGQCIGYEDLINKCGNKPHKKCRPECEPVIIGCSEPTKNQLEELIEDLRKCGPIGSIVTVNNKINCMPKENILEHCGSPLKSKCHEIQVP